MRRTYLVVFVVGLAARSNVHANEARAEVVVGREFALASGDVEVELLDGKLALGGGVTIISDFKIERYGAQASIEYRRERVSLGVDAAYSPRQWQRGWATLDPHAELSLEVGSWTLRSDGGALLRQIDAEHHRGHVAIRQLQVHGQVRAEYDERWKMGLFALYSFYDPDLRRPSLRGVDLGVAVTLAGKPERWAIGGRVEWTFRPKLAIEALLAATSYADESDFAVVPGIALAAGPWRGLSGRISVELGVDLGVTGADRLHPVCGLELAFAR
jgi:hypothetical protein